MIIRFSPDKADLILEAFYKTPIQMEGQGKALAQLYKMSSKNNATNSGFNSAISNLSLKEQIAFIADFIQESPKEGSTLFHPILSKQFLTLPFLSTIYSRPDVFTKDIRRQSLEALPAESMSAFIELLKYDIKNFLNYNIFKPETVPLNIGSQTSVIELILNIYCYTQNNSQYQSFIDVLPSYEELTKTMTVPVFQDALIFCRLHKEIVRDNSNPYLEDCSTLSKYLYDFPSVYFATILFCLSKDYNDEKFHSLKTKLLNSIIEKEHLNQDQFGIVNKELYDIFIENGNAVAKEFLDKYHISRDKWETKNESID